MSVPSRCRNGPRPGRRLLLPLALALSMGVALAQGVPGNPPAEGDPPTHSALDAPLFYQLLIGELELRNGETGAAYQFVLDAARRTRDETLFRRATEIASQARAGEQALVAAQAWRQALPASVEAHRYLVQILMGLNRPNETVEPVRSLIELTPPAQRPTLIQSLPGFYARATDRSQGARLLEQALQPFADKPESRTAAQVAMGRAWVAAAEPDKALAYTQRAHTQEPAAEGPALLAVELLSNTPAAEAIVASHLIARPDSNIVRMAYGRALTSAQRFSDAVAQFDRITRNAPQVAAPWLMLGALQVELRQSAEAIGSLTNYVRLAQARADESATVDDDGDEATPASPDRGLTQAWLLLAQAAEQQRDFAGAETWLAKIDNPQRALDVQTRRASLLVRQGKVKEARELIRRVPEREDTDARAKLLAEAQVLRDGKLWQEAHVVLGQANQKFPNDTDLLYEQSMTAEKLNRLDEMERLLRRVIELKPDHHHAYNALGYSLAERNLRLSEAKALIQKALALSPGEPFITDSLGWVEYRLGNPDESLRLLRQAYRARPDVEIAAHLGEVLWMLGQRDEARHVLREGRGRDAANEVLRETLVRLRVDL
jgi:tetratricopeptide (TPR) repeat protein